MKKLNQYILEKHNFLVKHHIDYDDLHNKQQTTLGKFIDCALNVIDYAHGFKFHELQLRFETSDISIRGTNIFNYATINSLIDLYDEPGYIIYPGIINNQNTIKFIFKNPKYETTIEVHTDEKKKIKEFQQL